MISESAPSAAYGHVCLAYDEPAALDARAVPFLAAGLAAGERVALIAPGSRDELARRLGRLPGRDAALRRGALRLLSIEQMYRSDAVIDPLAQVRAYDAATTEALAAGYAGLRVLAYATPLVRTPAQRDAFTRYEHLIDRFMRHRPMSAICAYDRRELGDAAIAELACMHPETNADVLFRLHATAGEAVVALGGELDPSNHRLFAAALDRADPRPADGRLVVDATGLRFVDHRSLLHLRDHARRHGATLVLRTAHPAAARLAELLDLPEVRVEVRR
ncbi:MULTISPECIES: MEDS domain-containing protein [Micromonospora]|uniref:STAS domain-containing protein n=1 Tax=Micromonospora solifontis TaxID=2487138 RepID=A0ABX9WL84_9ACTN|nr:MULTISPECIES: MEDS domain-containing protein [Micromonospora]NES14873.1 STAS domain-containing protein [Micromonospora sp. PPF5-17B]NES35204.1 STAS domain-containing protein [Micromonospora solifontis]NES55199.1 STAS domain-containing protein [Micromonospora sp. PPF5-6]RNM01182.1 STAS domain-containing protein [Micromonospora solifontis]